ncbi:hypothetical protein E4T42_02397 [Aureobasidium subglaciale]|uniref:Uncharacterized protein n=1 Tax=Aureobasidium subglaciale (strain EXF-2481) TaxID=1043005 RepID=A0A074YEQ7_AURSE|nr:uncharacterized protein AUEXF2481DRAFT_41127 [Aureobasidium subglaciale EXF-2481]KAI5196753.1 hypothetical protein E4T38_08338 [Aureobasidium subglaciale]KAI5213513.1 hypothetical protein E4T40_09665 [Aureobasidium subglaciale]KAI5215169.1 hypothetical protein E4T41_09703 [Aureobasidium subglaciale]KAI5254384.1 hypothetical protein E4T42_02397 [Aureobasidium subglaciale]KAI5256426.1 hypothetical protein E4T46_08238 [Aureobasidium subglaciale]
MPRGSEYSDEKRAAALIMFLIFKASHSEVETRTGVSKAAVRQMASRAHKAGIDRTSIEELIVFARTKPRKGRPRRDAATDKPSSSQPPEATESETPKQSHESAVAATQELRPQPANTTPTATTSTRANSREGVSEVMKSWNPHEVQAMDAPYTMATNEQG